MTGLFRGGFRFLRTNFTCTGSMAYGSQASDFGQDETCKMGRNG